MLEVAAAEVAAVPAPLGAAAGSAVAIALVSGVGPPGVADEPGEAPSAPAPPAPLS